MACGALLTFWSSDVQARMQPSETPARILITNDNGIEDGRLVALAEAFADAGAEVWVVAPAENRSGFTNYAPATGEGVFRVKPVVMGHRIRAYAVDGSPADSVVFAVTGPMRDRQPTLVVSGMNGGANAGESWIGSGTVGAARTAAAIGLRAVAVSGVPSRPEAHHRVAADWVVDLVGAPIVSELQAPDYVTVSFPELPLDQVKGAVLAPRANRFVDAVSERGDPSGDWETWTLKPLGISEAMPEEDVAVMSRGLIAVATMRVGDMELSRMAALANRADVLPGWTPVSAAPSCPLGVGVEDAAAGARVFQVARDSVAQAIGLKVGDILLQVDETYLVGLDSPVRTMSDVLGRKTCRSEVALRVQRNDVVLEITVRRLPQ